MLLGRLLPEVADALIARSTLLILFFFCAFPYSSSRSALRDKRTSTVPAIPYQSGLSSVLPVGLAFVVTLPRPARRDAFVKAVSPMLCAGDAALDFR